jgi:hypothetical protein
MRLVLPLLAALAFAVPAAAQSPATTPAAPAAVPTTPAPAGTTLGATTPTATTPTTTSTTAAAPATTRSAGDDTGLAPLLVGLAVLLGLSALAVLLWGIARVTAWEPSWLPATRHSVGEAAYRAGNTWAEFRDWLRPRRG